MARKEGHPPIQPPIMSDALQLAIDSLGEGYLRAVVKSLCHRHQAIIPTLEEFLLVQGKDVVPYHADTDSEDNENNDSESEESALEGDSDAIENTESNGKTKKTYAIAIANGDYTPRMAKCENCSQEFDVTRNHRGDCTWHPGISPLFLR